MKRQTILLILLSMIFLSIAGCSHAPLRPSEPEEFRVVTQIDVLYQKEPLVSEGNFSDPGKMQKILWYLRSISPYGTPTDDPEQVSGSDFYITLHYSDHTKKVYQQRDNRFMRIDNGPWKRIDPKKAVMLSQILGTIDSDTPDATAAPFLTP